MPIFRHHEPTKLREVQETKLQAPDSRGAPIVPDMPTAHTTSTISKRRGVRHKPYLAIPHPHREHPTESPRKAASKPVPSTRTWKAFKDMISELVTDDTPIQYIDIDWDHLIKVKHLPIMGMERIAIVGAR